MRRERAAVTMVLILSGFALALAIWQTISPFVPHVFWGASFAPDSGRVYRVFPAELPPDATVKRGDRVLTSGGIVAVVQKARDGSSEIEVEIAPNVRVTVIRETLTQVITGSTPAAANDAK